MMADGKNDTALGLGERLRSARKARALTLEQAAFTLRLEAPVLRALEDERYEVLGASVFVRGHLKAYARLLGLSEEAVMAAYRAGDPNADAPPKVTRELEKPLTTTPGPLAIAAAVFLGLLAMMLLLIFSSGPERSPAVAPTPDVTPALEPAPWPPPVPVDSAVPADVAPGVGALPGIPAPAPAPAVGAPAEPGAVAPVVTPAVPTNTPGNTPASPPPGPPPGTPAASFE